MVAFIFIFDRKVRSLRVITGSKTSNFDFSIKNLNRIQNLLRISIMFLVVVYDNNKCQKKNHFWWIPYGCAQTVTMFAMPKRIDWHATWYSYGIIWPWGPVTWGQILKLGFRGRHAWFTYKKHSGALGFAVISIIKKLFSKRFRLKRSLIFTFSLPSVTNDTQETEITTDKTEKTTESTPLALVSSSGASDVQPRPAAACVYVCVWPTAWHSIFDSVGLTCADNLIFRANVHKW